ncbi:MAG: hypothetical protein Q8O84_04620, partial [Nanoarchaeota archaeon]|nr:hypothetical protein [Nanoarchaeota archaeon]
SCEKEKSPNKYFIYGINLAQIFLRKMKNKIQESCFGEEEKNIERQVVEKKMRECFQKGFDYHQKEVANDKNLLKWVLKNNYIN